MFQKIAIAYFILIILSPYSACPQATVMDSLKNNISKARNQQEKLKAAIDFCNEWESYRSDTLHRYALMVDSMAIRQKDETAKLYAGYYLAVCLLETNKLDTALVRTNELLTQAKKLLPFGDIQIKLYKLRGNILARGNKPNELAASGFELLRLSEEKNDTSGMIVAKTGIGNAFFKMGKYEEATQWQEKALALMQTDYFKKKMCFVYLNLAVVFINRKKLDSCEAYIKKAIRYSTERGDLTDESNSYSFYSVLLSQTNRTKEAEAAMKNSVQLHEKIGDIYFQIAAMNSLAEFYVNTHQPKKAIAESLLALNLTQKIGAPFQQLIEIYEWLPTAYKEDGDYKKAAEILTKAMALKDSMYTANPTETIEELETKYEVQKKETTIIQQKLDISAKKNSIYVAFIISGILLLGMLYLFRLYYRRQKQQKQKQILAVAAAEEAERQRISADLHDNIGAYAAAAASTIATLNPQDAQSKTTLLQLRDTMQDMIAQLNDSIWALNKKAVRITGISDRFKLFIKKLEYAYPTVNIKLNEQIEEDRFLSPFQSLHLFRIMQESLNNALKHSKCNAVVVDIISNPGLFRISIADNGIGMQQAGFGGNGISNLKKRAEESGWNLSWTSNTPGGTRVIILENTSPEIN